MRGDDDAKKQSLSIISDLTLDGVYVPTVALDDRHLLTLDRGRSLRYVAAWAEAVARAEFDAAVMAQLQGMGITAHDAARTVMEDLRPDRPPLDDDATAPLRLDPIVSVRTLRGHVDAYLGDEHVMQLDAPMIYDHIAKVLPVAATCDLDAAYRRYAIGTLDQPAWRAEALVDDLRVWRAAETHGADQDQETRRAFAEMVNARPKGPRASRLAPTLLPDEVKEGLLAYASAVTAVRHGHRPPAYAAHIRQILTDRVIAAGLAPADVVPPVGASLNPGGRWIPPPKRRKKR